jgi:hypothetical protein
MLVVAMAAGSLAIWTAIPGAWLWLTREMQEDAQRFLLVIAGCAVTMLVAAALLYRLEGVYARAGGAPGRKAARRPPRPAWLSSVGEERRPTLGGMTLLDVFMAASAVIALIALVAWWVLLADNPNPSGPLQPL